MEPARAGAGGVAEDRAAELLERALAWTAPVLAEVAGVPAHTPTPCDDWDLQALLAHLSDSFAAFTEAPAGRVGLAPDPATAQHAADAGVEQQARRLQALGCSLLAGWVRPRARVVRLGARPVADEVVAEVGALEVAVHGWDLAQACGVERALPGELAAALLPVAVRRVGDSGRGLRFAPPVRAEVGADPASVLLAYLGRSHRPAGCTPA